MAQSATPSATALAALLIDDLPLVEPDPATLTVICDPEPSQIYPDAGETSVFCFDSVALGLRAVRTTTDATSRRAYLIRPKCVSEPCLAATLQTATVVLWTDAGTLAVHIDSTLDTVSLPESNVVGPWPFPGLFTSPAARLGELPPTPKAIGTRAAYPYCGSAIEETPLQVVACFRNSVIAGQPAEAIQHVVGTEGDEVIDLFRFDGAGAITRYEWSAGRWVHQRGGMILGAREGSWSFDPWGKGELVR